MKPMNKLGLSRAKLSTAGVEFCYVTIRFNVKVAFGLTQIN